MDKKKKILLGGIGVVLVLAIIIICVVIFGKKDDDTSVNNSAGNTEQTSEAEGTSDALEGSSEDEQQEETEESKTDESDAVDEETEESLEEDGEETEEVEEGDEEFAYELPANSIILFEGETDISYETNDVSWLLNAKDSDVITLIYTCTDATHTDWGVLGWGATINDVWTAGPEHKADAQDASTMCYVSCTAAELKSALGITSDVAVSYLKLGAWNGGKIVSLSIASEAADVKGASKMSLDGTVEGAQEEVVEEIVADQTAPGLSGSYLKVFNGAGEYWFNVASINPNFKPGDTISVSVTFEGDGGFGGAVGSSTGSDYVWQENSFSTDNAGTITCNFSGTVTIDNMKIGLFWLSGSAVGVKNISVTITASGSGGGAGTDPDGYAGAIQTVTANNTKIFINPTDYLSNFEPGDTIKIAATMYSDQYYNGTMGMNDSKGTWTSIGQQNCEGGYATWSITLKAGPDPAELQIWWVSIGDKVAVKNISVSMVSKGTGTEEPGEGDEDGEGEGEEGGEGGTTGGEGGSTGGEGGSTGDGTVSGGDNEDVTPDVPMEDVSVFEGSVESGDWSGEMQITADKFSDLKFDGTEKLVITYVSTDAEGPASQFKLTSVGSWAVLHEDYNAENPVTETTKKSVTLTEDYAVIATEGLRIQGKNWTISDVSVSKPIEMVENSIFNGSAESGSWGTNLEVAASNFSSLKFDGTEKLVITYVSTDAAGESTQFKMGTITDYVVLYEDYDAGLHAEATKKEIELTADWAATATNGLLIQGKNWTISDISIVAPKADESEEVETEDTSIYNGDIEAAEWGPGLELAADKFAGLKFDGTEKMIITYEATDAANSISAFKLSTLASWAVPHEDYGASSAAGKKEIVITDAFALAATEGLRIQGTNWKITDVTISVPKTEAGDGEGDGDGGTDSVIATTTAPTDFILKIADYCPEYQEGDTLEVTATLSSDAYFNGVIGGNVNGSWATTDKIESNAGSNTWTATLESVTGTDLYIQIWYMDGAATKVDLEALTITVKGEETDSVIATTTAPTDFILKIADYCPEYQEGDTLEVTATLTSDAYFNGVIGGNVNGSWATTDKIESNAGSNNWTATLENVTGTDLYIQIWYMDGAATKVDLEALTITVKSEETDGTVSGGDAEGDTETVIGSVTSSGEIIIKITDYCSDYVDGDTLNISAILSSDGSFNGVFGANTTAGWMTTDKIESAAGSNTWNATLANVSATDLYVQIWWMADTATKVDLESITITKADDSVSSGDAN